MDYKKKYVEIYEKYIHREGSAEMLDWIKRSDFLVAPASTRFHLSYEGGLCEHSVNVFDKLLCLLKSDEMKIFERCFGAPLSAESLEENMETVAIVSLLHDVCKASFYKPSTRNVKNKDTGRWETIPTYEIVEKLPMGHGEKSLFIVQSFMRLSTDEAISIRWHMGGFDNAVKGGDRSLNSAWEKCPLGAVLHIADMLATHIDELED